MQIDLQRAGSVLILTPHESIHRANSGELTDAALHAAGNDVKAVVLSFERLRTLSSEGIRVLITLRDLITEAGKAFRVCEAGPEIYYTLKITNLCEFFQYKDRLDAILEEYGTYLWKRSSASADAPDGKAAEREPSSGKPSSPTAPKAPPAVQANVSLTMGEAKALIERYLPGRLPIRIVQYFLEQNHDLSDAKALASALKEPETAIRDNIARLKRTGILKNAGGDLFNYAPEFELEQRILAFLKAWRNPQEHRVLLPLVLAAEK